MNYLTSSKSNHSIDKELWKKFILSLPTGNYFQHPDFLECFLESSKHEIITIFAINGQAQITGLICGIIYREFSGFLGKISNRIIIVGAPLIVPDEIDTAGTLINKFDETFSKRVIFTQFRNIFPLNDLNNYFLNLGYSFEEHLNVIIDLTKDIQDLWREIDSKRRNEIRKAEKEGTSVELIIKESDLRDTYNILCEVYSRTGLPLLRYNIFKAAFEKSKETEGFKAFGAFNSGCLIGTMYTLCYKETVYDWYAGSISKYYNKHSNDLIPWEVILWGKKYGFKKFDFGGAGKPGVPYGVREYKKKYGGKLVSYGRYEKINKPILMKIAKTGFHIMQSLKRKA